MICSTRPWFITTIRSDSASASDCACVTKTKVMPRLRLQQLQLVLNRLAQIGVERAERLVEQQDVGLDHQAPRERDALALAAGEPVSAALGNVARGRSLSSMRSTLRVVARASAASSPRGRSATLLAHRHMREQRVVLEDHRGRPPLGRQVVDPLALDQDVAGA